MPATSRHAASAVAVRLTIPACSISTGSGEELAVASSSWLADDSLGVLSPADLLLIYVDSFTFIMGSVILQYAFDPKNDKHCHIRGFHGRLLRLVRHPSSFLPIRHIPAAMLTGVLQSRFSHVEDGACIIGIQQRALIIPVAFDVFVSCPLHHTPHERNVERPIRTQGQDDVARDAGNDGTSCKREAEKTGYEKSHRFMRDPYQQNLIALLVLNGEPAWLCLICCKTDILVNALVIFWITSTRDSSTSAKSLGTSTGPQCLTSRLITIPANQPESDDPDILPHPGHAWVPPPNSASGSQPNDLSIDDILNGMENTDDFVRRSDISSRGNQNGMYAEGLENLREEDEEKKEDPWYCAVPDNDAAAGTNTHAE
ncbi:hypothetical protein PG997_012779 [Apiospora hydei]|uniref:Uncharacterized protein n=1 Tax=Apiospora hydei TaxID=1337664 RepID=A0ABR1V4B0_9PEZI